MPFVPVPGTAQVEAIYLLDGQICENVNYYFKDSAVTATDLATLLAAHNNAIQDHLLGALDGACSLERVVGRMIDTADGIVGIDVTGLPATGTSGDEPEPNNVTACVSLRTGRAGRSFRGRNYIVGLPDAATTGNTLTPTFRSIVLGYYDQLLALQADIGWQLVVVSRFSGFTIVDGKKVPTPRVEGIATAVTAAIFVDNTVDSQRRRLPGRGR